MKLNEMINKYIVMLFTLCGMVTLTYIYIYIYIHIPITIHITTIYS